MAGARDERVADLFFEDRTSEGAPAEEGLVRLVGGDLVAYVGGLSKSLTAGAGGGISEAQHNALRQLIHFVDDGPGDGFASGAFKETLYSGAFPTSFTWYADATKLAKLVELSVTYTGALPTSEAWNIYDVDGSTVLVTLTDTITYSGVFEQSRTRSIT